MKNTSISSLIKIFYTIIPEILIIYYKLIFTLKKLSYMVINFNDGTNISDYDNIHYEYSKLYYTGSNIQLY